MGTLLSIVTIGSYLSTSPIMDEAHNFFMECNLITNEAQFLVDALPNVETAEVERLSRQLDAIKVILTAMDDPLSTASDLEELICYVDSLLAPLDGFLSNPPLAPHTHIPRRHTGNRGRPEYELDLDRAILLHDLGNPWPDIAVAMGVSRSTLYNHMEKRGFSTARKEYSQLTDDELDELVSEISLAHPFAGITIVMGHLESRQVHASLNRTRDAWNHHKIRTAGHRTPIAIFELSREMAIQRGYWTGDNGDDLQTAADSLYGYDGDAPHPPAADRQDEPECSSEEPAGIEAEREAGICINDDEELEYAREQMGDFDFGRDDENWGIDVYCEAVVLLSSRIETTE
ncbi:Ethylene-and jasmonate-responsive plant defensin [Mycena sanguinolenta]|uniref:Ethylene-and jasmonate-responsive plant defensin n=1 Tax=Mycena sanguinolenta TaxID=230812 RepID=A0A8H6Z336_9AGAR|nr:Ethylene-and jasmonate-responsive plant defensin [Mycena sanguinolenta]